MIDWSEAAKAISTMVEMLALPSAQAVQIHPKLKARWAGRHNTFIHPDVQAEIILRLRNVSTVMEDGLRSEVIDDEHRETIVGQRLITVEIRVESHRHRQDINQWAWTMVGLIRTRLSRRSVREYLTARTMSVHTIGPASDISYTTGNREVNAATFEVVFVTAFRDINLDDSVEAFERALVTSKIAHSDGEQLPAPPNYTDEPMGLPNA